MLIYCLFLQIVGHTLGIHKCDVKCDVVMSIKSKTTSPLFKWAGSYDYFSKKSLSEGGGSENNTLRYRYVRLSVQVV